MTNDELWQAVLGEIELSISKANFGTWFKNTAILSNKDGRVVIGVPNGFAKEWLENKYNTQIMKALHNFQQEAKEIRCSIYNFRDALQSSVRNMDINRSSKDKLAASQFKPCDLDRVNQESNLNPRYLFENFIIGESNELARAACYAVSQSLGKVYNPLFIYGGVGLGKTHLLQSIGNEIIRKNPEIRVKYTTLERFANELVESIKNQTVGRLKDDYQKFNLLIIDDVQFLSGKEKTQNEFFHIFNSLYQFNKQIVLSSDRPPKAISTIEERLRSRFEGGMIADIGQPDLETRMAILKAKAAGRDFFIGDEAIEFIAENIKNNIRELEGALNRIIALCEFNREEPGLDFVRSALAEIISSGKKKGIQANHIIDAVSEFYGIKNDRLVEKGRKKEATLARQVAMYLLRSELDASYADIGERFGGRDHTTALHAAEKISKALEKSEKLKGELETIKEKIYSLR